jgi:hypothetical protein
MSQTCPRCRLLSPDSAMRCDCGFDFPTQTMATSYVQAHLIAKHGGAERFHRAEARRNLTRGVATLGIAGTISVASYLATGRAGFALLPSIGAAIWLLRAYRSHRESRAARQGEDGINRQ